MIRVLYACFFVIFFSFCAQATIVSGTVSDGNNKPLAFATIYVKDSTNGATSNNEGKYAIDLKPGKYSLVFQCIGYARQVKNVIVSKKPIILNVRLQPEKLDLKQANDTESVYEIISKAQAKRKYYLNQVNSYSCDLYIKNLWQIDSTSSHWMLFNLHPNAQKDELRLGIVYLLESQSQLNIPPDAGKGTLQLGILYLSESQSQFSFQKPGNTKEIMYSSRVSGSKQTFSWNQAGDFQFNFYNNRIDARELGSRGCISPIAESALFYYNYKLLGTFKADTLKIDKIQVIPKREHDPVFHGIIYIVENTWRIYGTDLALTRDANVDFIDTL